MPASPGRHSPLRPRRPRANHTQAVWRRATRATMLPSPPGGSASSSALTDHLVDIPQESVAVDDRCPAAVLEYPLLAKDALRIDEEKCSVRHHQFLVEDSVAATDL